MRDLVPVADRSGLVVLRTRTIRAMADILRRKRRMQVRRSRWFVAVGAIAGAVVFYGGWKLARIERATAAHHADVNNAHQRVVEQRQVAFEK